MPHQSPIRPDPMPLREALRGMRHVLRRGGETIADTVSLDALPRPAAVLANVMLREVGGLARNVDAMASGLAKSVIGGPETGLFDLASLSTERDADLIFARSAYVALQRVLDRLGAESVFISEAAACEAYAHMVQQDDADTPQRAAHLALQMQTARVLRGTGRQQNALVKADWIAPVALFAVLLWLQSTRSDADNAEALDAATDIAMAIAADIARVSDANDLTVLFNRYAPHV